MFFTTLDLGCDFWQFPLRKQDREKIGFACRLGLYEWKKMLLGLSNATFQRLVVQALTSISKKYGNLVISYEDDVVKATTTSTDHIDRLDEVFDCMMRARLKYKLSKYLGRMADVHGMRSDPDAVENVLNCKAPRTNTKLISFLGLAFTNENSLRDTKTKSTR